MGRGGRGRGNRGRGGPGFKPSPDGPYYYSTTTISSSTAGPSDEQASSSRGGRGRGRGRGGLDTPSRGRGRGRGRGGVQGGGGMPPGWSLGGDLGFASAAFANQSSQSPAGTPQPQSGANTPRRGRGRGAPQSNNFTTPRGRGRGQPDFQSSPRRGGFGLGSSPQAKLAHSRGAGILRGDAPLSGLLYQDRPLLKPIAFVPSRLTRVLFQEEEEIFQPVVEETDNTEQSHIPTADRVTRIFSGGDLPPMSSSEDENSHAQDEDMEEIEEIDFNDMASLMEASTQRTTTKVSKKALESITESQFTGFFVAVTGDRPQDRLPEVEDRTSRIEENMSGISPAPDEPHTIDVTPTILPNTTSSLPFQDPAILQVGPTSPPTFPTATPSTLPPLLAAAFASVSSPQYLHDVPTNAAPPPSMTVTESTIVDPPTTDIFVIDVEPGPAPADLPPAPRVPLVDDDDEIIVYVAPHPRKHSDYEGSQEGSVNASATVSATTVNAATAGGAPPMAEDPVATPLVAGSRATTTHSTTTSTNTFEPYERPATLASILGSTLPTSVPLPSSPVPEPPSISSMSFSFSSTRTEAGQGTPSRLRVPPVTTPRLRKAWERKRGLTTHSRSGKNKKQKMGHYKGFGSFGAMHEEAMLRGEEMFYDDAEDPKWEERRRGDSDLEWGDGDEVELGQPGDDDDDMVGRLPASVKGKGKARSARKPMTLAEAEEDAHGMAVDVGLDDSDEGEGEQGAEAVSAKRLAAMQSFVDGMLGAGSGVHKTIGDIEDEEMMRLEDEEGMGGETSDEDDEDEDEDDEEEAYLRATEGLVVDGDDDEDDDDEDDDDDDDSDDDEDLDITPRRGFEARLERLRQHSRSKKASRARPIDDDDEDDFDELFTKTWADEDEDFLDQMDAILQENIELLNGSQGRRNRKARKELFKAIQNGEFDEDDEGFRPAPRNRDKGKFLPPDLRAQWEKDRQKKAEYKKQRELEKLLSASDPMAKKKGGRKGKKAMLIAASRDPSSTPITVLPNRIIDFTTLVQQIRRFITNLGGPTTISLPPTSKETRKIVHEIATVFGLKSLSKGKGDARYITLTRTTRTGTKINEAKLAKILRRTNGRGDTFVRDGKNSGGGGGAGRGSVRHREGEVVGKAAPKLTESNVGFRMLAMMGWSEGMQIGSSGGGIDAPLTAVIKHTRLGLGATR